MRVTALTKFAPSQLVRSRQREFLPLDVRSLIRHLAGSDRPIVFKEKRTTPMKKIQWPTRTEWAEPRIKESKLTGEVWPTDDAAWEGELRRRARIEAKHPDWFSGEGQATRNPASMRTPPKGMPMPPKSTPNNSFSEP
jgi:hypothetical protein